MEVPNMAIAALPGKGAILATLSELTQNMSCPSERKRLQICWEWRGKGGLCDPQLF